MSLRCRKEEGEEADLEVFGDLEKGGVGRGCYLDGAVECEVEDVAA